MSMLFKLDPMVDDPKFEGFAFERTESLRGKVGLVQDFVPDDRQTKGRAWTVTPLAPFWTPQPVVGRVRKFNDYPCVNMLIPAFSRRAVDALRDFLEPNGELLPLASSVGEYYAYNITTVADVLDQERSEFQWLDEGRTFKSFSKVVRYECIPEKMEGLSIFRIVEEVITPFVSSAFVDRVMQHELRGFLFTKLWAPADSSGQGEGLSQVETESVQGNTVVIMFPTAKAKPSRAEKDRLATIMDQIDAVLADPDAAPDSTHYGSLEGDDVVEGDLRLFLSCPNADALIARLRPLLEELNGTWKKGVKVLKRYGQMQDPSCPEKYIHL